VKTPPVHQFAQRKKFVEKNKKITDLIIAALIFSGIIRRDITYVAALVLRQGLPTFKRLATLWEDSPICPIALQATHFFLLLVFLPAFLIPCFLCKKQLSKWA